MTIATAIASLPGLEVVHDMPQAVRIVLLRQSTAVPAGVDVERAWTPVRYVREAQTCAFCWGPIPAGSPGSRTGTRGTRAWYNAVWQVWECIPCRDEATRSHVLSTLSQKESPVVEMRLE